MVQSGAESETADFMRPPFANPRQRNQIILTLTVLLLFFAAHRILSFAETEMHIDEIWTMWQTLGTPAQIINWTPFDWMPLSYLTFGAWRGLVGMHPVALRVLPMLTFMISAAILYRAARWVTREHQAALLIVLVYGAFGYVLRASTELRGYMLAITCIIALWWLLMRYIRRPALLTGVLCGLLIAVSFYTYLPAAMGWVAIGLSLLAVYRLRALKAWLPALFGLLLIIPGLAWRWNAISERTALDWQYTGTFWEMLLENFNTFSIYRYVGSPALFWQVAFVIATLCLLAAVLRARKRLQYAPGAAVWALALPVLLFIVHTRTDFFRLHYSMMWLIGLVVWIGWGLAQLGRLHRLFVWGSAAAVILVMLLPTQLTYYAGYWRPWMTNLSWLRERYRPGDVVVVDPNCCLGHRYEWDYMVPLYFPEGLNIQPEPGDARRVWYITYETQEDTTLDAEVQAGRIARPFVGPPEFFFRLYEAPPDRPGIPFENGMRFHGAEVMRADGELTEPARTLVRREGEPLRLRLWWSVDETPPLDYSVAIHLLGDDGRLLAQSDGAPQLVTMAYPPEEAPRETNQWQPGRYYVEERMLNVPTDMTFETLTATLTVYDWRSGARVNAPGLRDDLLLELFTMRVESWTGGLSR